MLIREFNMTDYYKVIRLWEKCNIVLGISDSVQEFKKVHDSHPDLILVGEINNKIISAVLGSFDGRRGWVHHLAVDPEYQGKGYGKMLIDELEKRFIKYGVVKYHLMIFKDNLKVVNFYKKLGFHLRDDIVTMSKALKE